MAERAVGFLHTSDTHVARFDALMHSEAREVAALHHVDASLLDRAGRHGPQHEGVVAATRQALHALAERGASVVVCTCSTIGALAEDLDAKAEGFRALRIDRPMADAATRSDGRLLVLAALESSIEPTRSLLADSARKQDSSVSIDARVVDGAWQRFEAGDTDAYLHGIAEAARSGAGDATAVVLAQASMAECEPLCSDLGIPVWSSPRTGVRAALALLAES